MFEIAGLDRLGKIPFAGVLKAMALAQLDQHSEARATLDEARKLLQTATSRTRWDPAMVTTLLAEAERVVPR